MKEKVSREKQNTFHVQHTFSVRRYSQDNIKTAIKAPELLSYATFPNFPQTRHIPSSRNTSAST